MKCSLGMLCEPLKSLGLHGHKSAVKKSVQSGKKVVKKPAKKSAARKKRK